MAPSREPAASRHAGGRPRDAALDEAILRAARARLIEDGYSRMTISDIAADAGVTRPTVYRRWKTKLDLVVDALDYGFLKQGEMYDEDLSDLGPREALVEVVRRSDPAYFNPDAMVLVGNFAAEAIRTPELMEVLRAHAIEPRVSMVEKLLGQLRERGEVGGDIDARTIASICSGAYVAAFFLGEDKTSIPERVVAALWPGIRAQAPRSRPSAPA